ncbi:lipopolysaccharide biosynthesis protein [Aquipseudomonas alcaligenes]|uniref:Oligosaccharide flippase family protein n=1 Tax=Aquipseudomonas alcaligenes TaxID=43263 RepID=A0AB73HU71_AQUAC|nr:oligosaccharide flippase family protein [Pseudomonas alcaligenes]MDH0140988.1 oligosaccharide flippase family protein [Pseudomonas alcaligenes]
MSKLKGKSLLSGAAIYLFANVLNAAVPFLLLPILTRYLDPAEYGKVAMFQTLVAALAALVGLNVQGAASRKFFDEDAQGEGLRLFIGSCFQVLLLSSLAVLAVVAVFHDLLSSWLGIPAEWLYLSIGVSVASFIVNMRLGQWQVRRQAKAYGVLQVTQSLAIMLMSIGFVVVLSAGAEGRVWAQLLAVFCASLIACGLLYKDRLVHFLSWRPNYIKEALAFGVPLIPHVVGAFLLFSVDRFVINSEFGLEAAGLYMVAVQISLVLGVLFDSVNKAYVPWLFERLSRGDESGSHQLIKYSYFYFLLLLSLALLAFWLGPVVVRLFAGEQYAMAGTLIGWLALGQSFKGMYFTVTGYIFYQKKTSILSLITIVSGGINLAGLLVGISLFGLEGAAIAFAVAMACQFIFSWMFAAKVHPMPWLGVFRRKKMA